MVEAVVGSGDVSVTWTEPTATDDSGSVGLTQTASPGDTFPFGTTEVAYTFSDLTGNSAVCSFNVIVSGMCNIYATLFCYVTNNSLPLVQSLLMTNFSQHRPTIKWKLLIIVS